MIKPKKYLGQNFLISKKIVSDIIRAADLQSNDTVLEVGPGKGILTEAILEKIPIGKLIAVEKDKQLVEYLTEKFSDAKNLKIINDDILKIDILDLIENCKLKIENYKIVANIPYYLTSRLLRQFLQGDFQPSRMILMVQKEVAERIIAKDGKESILSVSVKVYGEPKIVKIVSASYFSPQPKVDSAILLIDNISKGFFSAKGGPASGGQHIDEKKFFILIKQGFASKRKLLKNNLKLLDIGCLTKCGIAEKVRVEDLSPENWKCLYKSLV